MRFCVFTLSIPALGVFEITKQIQFGNFVTPWQGVSSKVFRQNVSNTKRVFSTSMFDKFIVHFWSHVGSVFLGGEATIVQISLPGRSPRPPRTSGGAEMKGFYENRP